MATKNTTKKNSIPIIQKLEFEPASILKNIINMSLICNGNITTNSSNSKLNEIMFFCIS